MFYPQGYRHEWSDADACKDAISGGRGAPRSRILLPYDPRSPLQRQSVGIDLPGFLDSRVTEIAGGWEFELGTNYLLRMRHVNDAAVVTLPAHPAWKIELQMDVPPPVWQYTFTFSVPPGTVAFYQPPLIQAEIDDGAYMPPEVEHSYAIYRNGGKIAHLYRLHVEDAAGAREWCVTNLIGDQLTVRLPKAWMESAERVWPITLDPYIGYNTVGGTAHAFAASQLYTLGKSTMTEDGTATKMEAYVRTSTTAGRTMGVYNDAAGAPNTLARDTGEDTQAGTGWLGVNLDTPLTVASGAVYWVAFHSGSTIDTYRDAAPVNSLRYKASETYNAGLLPDPNPWAFAAALEYSLRCEYTAAGGLSIPIAAHHYKQLQGAN